MPKLNLEKIADEWCKECHVLTECYKDDATNVSKINKECFDRFLKLRQTIAAEKIAKYLKPIDKAWGNYIGPD